MNQIFTRYEFKYPMPEYYLPGIKAFLLKSGMHIDPGATTKPDSAYTVTSLYFDSPFLNDYNDKAGGFLLRKKIRARIYTPLLTTETPEIWLEKKIKHDMLVAKKRFLLTFNSYRKLISGSRTQLLRENNKNPYAAEIISDIIGEQMKPHIIIRYKRVPLQMQGPANFRITLDSGIETCFSGDLCYAPSIKTVYPGTAIMEVKFSTLLPAWFKTMLHMFNLERAAFSKYANSLETLRVHNPIPR